MAWVRIDDQFYEHPKWRSAPTDSIALWMAAIAWCNHYRENTGFIPAHKLNGLLAGVRNPRRTVADLVQRGALIAHEDGYLIHEYREWQQIERMEATSAVRSANGKKGATSRWGSREPMATDMANANGNSHANRDGRRPTTDDQCELVRDQTDSENTPAESSSSDPLRTAARAALAEKASLVLSERSNTRTGSVKAYAVGIAAKLIIERLSDIDRCIDRSLGDDDAIAVLIGKPEATRTPTDDLPSARWFGTSIAQHEHDRDDPVDAAGFAEQCSAERRSDAWSRTAAHAYLTEHARLDNDNPLATVTPIHGATA